MSKTSDLSVALKNIQTEMKTLRAQAIEVRASLKAARVTKPRTPKQPPAENVNNVDGAIGEAAPAKPRRAKPDSQ